MLKTKLLQLTAFFLPPVAQWDQKSHLVVWESGAWCQRRLVGSLLLQAPLRLEADTPDPERFLITAQEPNYPHALASGDSEPPRALTQALVLPTPPSRGFCLCIFICLYLHIASWR